MDLIKKSEIIKINSGFVKSHNCQIYFEAKYVFSEPHLVVKSIRKNLIYCVFPGDLEDLPNKVNNESFLHLSDFVGKQII